MYNQNNTNDGGGVDSLLLWVSKIMCEIIQR